MILAVLQARMSSTRLPGKVLKPILGRPMLARQIERILDSGRIDRLVVATSDQVLDDPLAAMCGELGVDVYRGSLDNVLDRFYCAAKGYAPDHVVRLTGDCPFIDPDYLDGLVDFYLAEDCDYASYCRPPSLPDGLDAEIFTFAALEEAWQEAELPSHLEHVVPFIVRNPDRYSIRNQSFEPDLSHLRWTVDEPDDFRFATRVYEELYPVDPRFRTADILNLLKRLPELSEINGYIARNAGTISSQRKDAQYVASRSSNVEPKDITKGFALQEHAKTRIPGLSQLLSKRPDRFSYGVWPGYFSKAEGVRAWDLDGNEYVDMSIGGIGATVLGYQDPDVDGAVKEAIGRGVASSLNCPEEVELADLLCELHPWAEMARFVRCGGEAVAVAVRIARAATGRDTVAFCGYHGWHDWYLAANLGTENALGEHLISGLDPHGVPAGLAGTALAFGYNDLEAFRAIMEEHGPRLAAIVMEPIRSEDPHPGFFPEIVSRAKECGVPLILDEVSSGFRMNTGGAHLVLGVEPDVAVFSKALGNGYPMAAVIGKPWVMEAAQRSFISSTNWTERIGPVAALATIRKHRAVDAGPHLMALGRVVQQGWKDCAAKHGLGISVGGIPPLSHFGFQVDEPLVAKAYFVQCMLERGFLASTNFYAMYAHTMEDVQSYLEAADQVFGLLAAALAAGDLRQRLRGRPAASGFKRLA